MWLPWLEPRADANNPCPEGNGTTIGDIQQFVLICGSTVVGDTINSTTTTTTFSECVDYCASFHPRCEAVSFNSKLCDLKANISPDKKTRPAKRADGAIAQFPQSSSNCATLGSSTTTNSTSYSVFCGNIIDGNDLTQGFAATFQDCMDMCSSTTGCGGLSFDSTMGQGFKNCYLKGAASANSPIVDSGIDSAIVGDAVAAPAPVPSGSSSQSPTPSPSQSPSPSPSSSPSPTVTPQPTVASTPAPTFATTAAPGTKTKTATATVSVSADPITVTANPLPASTSGGGFITLTADPTGTALSETQTIYSVITSVINSTPVLLTVPVTDSPYAVATGVAGSSIAVTDDSSAKAWIAAPVVGSVAAVTVIAAAFVIWGRRRTRSGSSSPKFPKLPFMRSRSDLGSVNDDSKSRGVTFGNYWRMGSRDGVEEPARAVSRSGAVSRGGPLTTSVTRESTPQYEVKQGKMSLRDSLNGLNQNRSTLDGIPGFLRE